MFAARVLKCVPMLQGLAPVGFRLVRLPARELGTVHRLKAALGRYSRMRFIVVVEVTVSHEGCPELSGLQDEPTGV